MLDALKHRIESLLGELQITLLAACERVINNRFNRLDERFAALEARLLARVEDK